MIDKFDVVMIYIVFPSRRERRVQVDLIESIRLSKRERESVFGNPIRVLVIFIVGPVAADPPSHQPASPSVGC